MRRIAGLLSVKTGNQETCVGVPVQLPVPADSTQTAATAACQQARWLPIPPAHCRYAPTEEVGDVITAPRNWHFSNRTEEEAPERDTPDTHRSKAAQE